LVTTIIHYSFLDASYDTELLLYNNHNVHASQSLLAFVDTFISSRPWKMGHFYFVIVYGLVYFTFQIVYIMGFDGTNQYCHDYIYGNLNWKSGFGNALTIIKGIAIFVLMIFCHFLFCLLTLVRDKLWLYTHKKSSNRSEIDIEKEHHTYIPRIVVEDKEQAATCSSDKSENNTKSIEKARQKSIFRLGKKDMRKKYRYRNGCIEKNGKKFHYKF